jgi:lysophospholipase L1-like esterase
MKHFLIVFLLYLTIGCDSPKGPTNDVLVNLACYSFAQCGETRFGTKYGMLGDSWTDLLGGIPLIDSLNTHLRREHGYQITGANLGGRTMKQVLEQGLHLQVVKDAGADLKYVIISMGGNDLQGNVSGYRTNIQTEKARRLGILESGIKELTNSMNFEKSKKYGSGSLIFFIHGYDYPNPDNYNPVSTTSCRETLVKEGFISSEVDPILLDGLNSYNNLLYSLTNQIPNFYYIDLRGTLGGPPYSNKDLMYDCIHPTSAGFSLLANKLNTGIQSVAGGEK